VDFWLGRDESVIDPARIARTTAALIGSQEMSWSLSVIGTPDAVKRALADYSESLRDQSKSEFDEALPALEALVGANVGGQAVKLVAAGHATFEGDQKTSGNCSVVVEPFYGKVCA